MLSPTHVLEPEVPIANIEAWVSAKGVDVSAWAVATKIARDGSRDWRNRAPNVFLSAMDDFEQGGGLERLEDAGGSELETVAADMVAEQLKRAWQTSR